MKYVFTSITKGYLPKARVCAKTLKSFHPDWHYVVIFSDSLPDGFSLDEEPFDSVYNIRDLGIEDLDNWIFKHNIVEICTAVKGSMLKLLLEKEDAEFVMYIDPDIAIYNELMPLVDRLKQNDILLTPHLLQPEHELDLINGNEIATTLAHGIYNLGFIAVANSQIGHEFAEWWKKRLLNFCYDDVSKGLFTDQRWCDFIPAFFETHYIIRDIGYNVATWNIRHRPITKGSDGKYMAGNVPLRFYHFTGYDKGYNYSLLQRFARGYPMAFELWEEYGNMLEQHGQSLENFKHWEYATYDSGELIGDNERLIYRSDLDLQEKYANPFKTDTNNSYYNWYRENIGFEERKQFNELVNEISNLRAQLNALYDSTSWEITRPLRLVSTILKKKGW